MGNLLFSPSGRVGPAEFMKGATALVILSLILSLLAVFLPALTMITGLIGLILIWCWIVLWIKRYHDGGKSGWMCLIPIIAWFIALMIFSFVVKGMFTDPAEAEALAEATASGDFMTVFSIGNALTLVGDLVYSIGGALISYLVALLFNNMIKSDPHDNQFGPATPSM